VGRARELLADRFGAQRAAGSLVAWVRPGAASVERVDARSKAALARAPVLHSDETGVQPAGRVAWAHVACTARLTHYASHSRRGTAGHGGARRGTAATDAMGILPRFTE